MQRLLLLPSSSAAAAAQSGGGSRAGGFLRLRRPASSLLLSHRSTSTSAPGPSDRSPNSSRRRRPLPLSLRRGNGLRAAPFGTKAGGGAGGGDGPPHPELFLAELFGGVVNRPREGTVIQLHEGSVARVSGLREARIHDLVAFGEEKGARKGLVFDLEQNTVAVALLDQHPPVREGEDSTLLGAGPAIPVGPALLGRVVDPLGRPLAGLDPPSSSSAGHAGGKEQQGGGVVPLDPEGVVGTAPLLHRAAPGIMARKPLCSRLITGVKALDAFHPVAQGQCVGLLGRRGSGKTTLALQVIANQGGGANKGEEGALLRCVYVAIGQDPKAVQRAVEHLERAGCLDNVTIVAANADMPPGLRYLAPFAGCALGEHWAEQGGRALVVLDDLSRHAEAYSELAKFMSKPEVEKGLALHGPLLERFAQLSDARGGGAMTGLALVDGEANEGEEGGGLAHRIYSIVDHAINLNLDLARRRAFPAVDVTHQMNLQSPGAALLPEPTKAFVQKLRVKLAEALDDEAGAKMAAELGILADEEAEEAKVERLDYLRKVRLLFLQGGSGAGAVDEGGLLLCLLACLREEVLLDLDGDVVRQLDAVLSGELPRAKGWKRLAAQVEALARRSDGRAVADAFMQAHQSRQGRRGQGGRPALPLLSSSASIGEESRTTAQEAEGVYAHLHDILTKAVNYSRKKALVARMTEGGSAADADAERIKDRAAAVAALKRRNYNGSRLNR